MLIKKKYELEKYSFRIKLITSSAVQKIKKFNEKFTFLKTVIIVIIIFFLSKLKIKENI